MFTLVSHESLKDLNDAKRLWSSAANVSLLAFRIIWLILTLDSVVQFILFGLNCFQDSLALLRRRDNDVWEFLLRHGWSSRQSCV